MYACTQLFKSRHSLPDAHQYIRQKIFIDAVVASTLDGCVHVHVFIKTQKQVSKIIHESTRTTYARTPAARGPPPNGLCAPTVPGQTKKGRTILLRLLPTLIRSPLRLGRALLTAMPPSTGFCARLPAVPLATRSERFCPNRHARAPPPHDGSKKRKLM